MMTIKQKPVIDTHTQRKEYKRNIKGTHQITREESKMRGTELQKQQNRNKYIPINNYFKCK